MMKTFLRSFEATSTMSGLAEERVLLSLSGIHRRKHEEYARLLDETASKSASFWDVVVITAVDEEQHSFYSHQLAEKKKKKEIPSFIRYHIVADPPGTKIGCGGSTMYVLEFLESEYGQELDKLKVLVIHAGGYSKRLPNHSATGKIFASVPCPLREGGPACSMLELKFILFIDFPKNMAPGIFVSCADDIEFFESEGCDFTRPGFTAMAHPAPANIGLTHGVFVLEDPSAALIVEESRRTPAPCSCKQFLHKSSLSTMQSSGAFLPPLPFASSNETEHVFVDSNFYFDRGIAKLLLEFYKEEKPLQCEVDAYGDFLQPLGSNPNDGYLQTAQNVIAVTDSLQGVRTKLYHLLKGKPLHVLPFVPSLFLHIGTCDEYLEHFCYNLGTLGFTHDVFTSYGGEAKHGSENISSACCLLHSIIADNSSIDAGSVLEYCHMENVRIGKDCILSDINVIGDRKSIISDNIFMQTLPISPDEALTNRLKPKGEDEKEKEDDRSYYVTAVFGSRDDFKKGVTKDKISQLKVRGESLSLLLDKLQLGVEDVWHVRGEELVSLWNARLFPVEESPEGSARAALDFIRALDGLTLTEKEEGTKNWAAMLRISWEDALQLKDMKGMILHRQKQEEIIKSRKGQ